MYIPDNKDLHFHRQQPKAIQQGGGDVYDSVLAVWGLCVCCAYWSGGSLRLDQVLFCTY